MSYEVRAFAYNSLDPSSTTAYGNIIIIETDVYHVEFNITDQYESAISGVKIEMEGNSTTTDVNGFGELIYVPDVELQFGTYNYNLSNINYHNKTEEVTVNSTLTTVNDFMFHSSMEQDKSLSHYIDTEIRSINSFAFKPDRNYQEATFETWLRMENFDDNKDMSIWGSNPPYTSSTGWRRQCYFRTINNRTGLFFSVRTRSGGFNVNVYRMIGRVNTLLNPINDNQWHHVALTVYLPGTMNSTCSISVDGIAQPTSVELYDSLGPLPPDNHFPFVDDNFYVGGTLSQDQQTHRFFKGSISEFRMWRRRLSQSEILYYSNFNKPCGTDDSLTLYYDINNLTDSQDEPGVKIVTDLAPPNPYRNPEIPDGYVYNNPTLDTPYKYLYECS